MDRPAIGTAVWVRKEGKLLLGLRTKERGYGTWAVPGGHLEMNETLEECIAREAQEEASVDIENITFATFTEHIANEHKAHYVTFVFVADWKNGDVTPDPSEFESLEWFDWNNLPQPLFVPTRLFVEKGINPIEI